jgi:hypothetical protein
MQMCLLMLHWTRLKEYTKRDSKYLFTTLCMYFSPRSYELLICLSHPPWFHSSQIIWWRVQIMKLTTVQFSPIFSLFHSLNLEYSQPSILKFCHVTYSMFFSQDEMPCFTYINHILKVIFLDRRWEAKIIRIKCWETSPELNVPIFLRDTIYICYDYSQKLEICRILKRRISFLYITILSVLRIWYMKHVLIMFSIPLIRMSGHIQTDWQAECVISLIHVGLWLCVSTALYLLEVIVYGTCAMWMDWIVSVCEWKLQDGMTLRLRKNVFLFFAGNYIIFILVSYVRTNIYHLYDSHNNERRSVCFLINIFP